MKRNLKESKGITLVALIITIIVLLILAVVTIAAVNEGSLFSHANNAATKYNEKAIEENTLVSKYLSEMAKHDNGTTGNVEYYLYEFTEPDEMDESVTIYYQEVIVIDYDNNCMNAFAGSGTVNNSFDLEYLGSINITLNNESFNINIGNADDEIITEELTVNGATAIYIEGEPEEEPQEELQGEPEYESWGYIKEGKLYIGARGKNDRSIMYFDLSDYFSLIDSSITSRFVYNT